MSEIEKNPKLKKLLDAANDLFFKHGVKRVTIEEICEKADVSKMTFYKYFPNKTAIAKEILQNLYDYQLTQMQKVIAINISIPEKLETIIQVKISDLHIFNFGFDFLNEMLGNVEPELAQFLDEQNTRFKNFIREIILNEQKKGTISSDVNIDFIIYLIFRIRDSLKEEEAIKMFPDPASMLKELLRILFYGIVGNKK